MQTPPSALFDHEVEFKARYFGDTGMAFQTLFQEIMERAHPDDFRPVRPHGPLGDRKSDGYLASERTVYQVYAPVRSWRLADLLRKIDDDYRGALEHWPDMSRWTFVHNFRDGLPADAVQRIEALPEALGGPPTSQWGYEELRARAVRPVTPRRPSLVAMEQYWAWRADEQASPPAHLRPMFEARLPVCLRRPDEDGRHPNLGATPAPRRGAVADTRWEVAAPDLPQATATHEALYRFVREHRRVVITGDAGSGKSRLLERFARNQAHRLLRVGPGRRGRHTPVLVELWRFGPGRTLLDLVAGAVARADATVPAEQVRVALELGYLVVLLDGLDEVAAASQTECLAQIESLTETFPRAPIVLTSRPGVRPPSRFTRLVVEDLTDADIRTALRAVRPVVPDRLSPQRDSSWDDVYPILEAAREACRQPLALALVLYVLSKNEPVPPTLYGLYERVEAWLLDWDVQKDGLRSAHGPSDVLPRVAYHMASADQPSLSESEWLSRGAEGPGGPPDAAEALRHGLSSGVLSNEGGLVRFAHRTFYEYFSARWIQRTADPVPADVGVIRFVASARKSLVSLLDLARQGCQDIRELVPLFDLAFEEGLNVGSYEPLAAAFAEEEVWAYDLGPDETPSDYAAWLSGLCEEYAPKAVSLVPQAAWVTAYGGGDPEMAHAYRRLAVCLDKYERPSAAYYRAVADRVENSVLCRHPEGPAWWAEWEGGAHDLMIELNRALEAEDYALADSRLAEFKGWLGRLEEAVRSGMEPEA